MLVDDTIIYFYEEDMTYLNNLHVDGIDITAEINRFKTKRIFYQDGISSHILFLDAFKSMCYK